MGSGLRRRHAPSVHEGLSSGLAARAVQDQNATRVWEQTRYIMRHGARTYMPLAPGSISHIETDRTNGGTPPGI
jgi:hypothetical protein